MRTNTLDAARRSIQITRVSINDTNDDGKLQTHTIRGLYNELIPNVERLQHYGLSSVPLPPDQDGNAAEAVMVSINGNRSHPMVPGLDDKRYRQTNLQPGDVSLHDFTGANLTFSKNGLMVNMGSNKKPMSITSGKGSLYVSDSASALQHDKAQVKVTSAKITSQLKDSTITQDGSTTTIKQGSTTVVINGSSVTVTVGGTSLYVSDGKIGLGGSGASIPVMLQSGPSSLVFATK